MIIRSFIHAKKETVLKYWIDKDDQGKFLPFRSSRGVEDK